MELINFEHLYRKLFQQTNGFVLNWPIGLPVEIGDFFVLKPKKLSMIGCIPMNILDNNKSHVYDTEQLDFTVPSAEPEERNRNNIGSFPANDNSWNLAEGCSSDYISNKMLSPHKSKLVAADVNQFITSFDDQTNFFFSTSNVRIDKILDFHKLHKRIIRILATQFFNYSEVYFITEVAHIDHFSVGVSKQPSAKLVMSLDKFYNGDILDITSSETSLEVERAEGLSHLKIREKGGKIAFKALKLSLIHISSPRD